MDIRKDAMKVVGKTDVGCVKKFNQDNLYYSSTDIGFLPNLFIIADGMGGYKSGDVASKLLIDKIVEDVRNTSIEKDQDITEVINMIIVQADNYLVAQASSNDEYKGMGSTLVFATIIDNDLIVANVGDSRLYILLDKLRQITEDHSVVMELLRNNIITKSEAENHIDKHKITRAMGYGGYPDFYKIKVKPGDRILMCTDGLTNMLKESYIEEVLSSDILLDSMTSKLIETAKINGGEDNISAIIIEID